MGWVKITERRLNELDKRVLRLETFLAKLSKSLLEEATLQRKLIKIELREIAKYRRKKIINGNRNN